MLSEPDRPGVPHPAYRNAGAVWMGLAERALEHARPDRLERRLADRRTVPNPACAAILARRGTDGRKPRCRTPSRRDSRRRCGRLFSAANARAAVLAGQIEKLALYLGEQAWRKEAIGENPGPTRYGIEAGVRPLVDIVLGDDDPARFVVQLDRSPDLHRDLDPDGIT